MGRRRIIEDQELRERLEAGDSQRECAAYFDVSPSAISQRVAKLKSYELPESVQKLTVKQRDFALLKAEGRNSAEAVRAVYDVSTDDSAKSLGRTLMKDPDIQTAIFDLMHQEGIGRRHRVKRLKDMIDCKDLVIAGKGLDMSFKLDGYVEKSVHVDFSFTDAIKDLEEIKKEREALARELGMEDKGQED